MLVNGTQIRFLCDTGACRTVVKQSDAIFPYKKSNETIFTRSASGDVEKQKLTEPVEISDDEETVSVPILVSDSCPVNLLGRDVMTKLGIGVIPGDEEGGRWKAIKLESQNALEANGVPYFWYCIALSNRGPNNHNDELLKLAKDALYETSADFMPHEKLHCTTYYRTVPGRGYTYEARFEVGTPTTMHAQNIYWGKDWAGVSIILSAEDVGSFKELEPHVSLAKGKNHGWVDIGKLIDRAKNCGDWKLVDLATKVYYSARSHTYTQSLNWVLRGVRQRYLCGPPDIPQRTMW